jgi:hypothetical protein
MEDKGRKKGRKREEKEENEKKTEEDAPKPFSAVDVTFRTTKASALGLGFRVRA